MSPRRLWLIALASLSCGVTFSPPSLVSTVRILAIQANPPYAAPGTPVELQILAVDGRAAQPQTMTVAWLPQACIDPPADTYYACYAPLASILQPGQDITSSLTSGSTFSFTMPDDVITNHGAAPTSDPYGLAFTFAVACAGKIEYVGFSKQNPSANPLGCFDESGNALDANSFVFAYSTIYSFTDRTNSNPVISNLTFNGNAVDPTAGITIKHVYCRRHEEVPDERHRHCGSRLEPRARSRNARRKWQSAKRADLGGLLRDGWQRLRRSGDSL